MPRNSITVIIDRMIGAAKVYLKRSDTGAAMGESAASPVYTSAVLSGSSVSIGDATAAKQDAQTALLTTIDADTSKIPTDPAKESGKLTTIDSTLTALNALVTAGNALLTEIKATAGVKKITDAVAVTTVKPDGTNTAPSMDVAGRAGFIQITDGTDTETLHTENVAIGTSIGPVLLTRSTGGAAVSPVVGTALVDGASGNYSGFFVNSRNEGWDGATWDLFRVADLCADVQGASPQTLIAATASKKHRIHSITLSADTTGLITISDGIGRFYWTAGNPPISIVFANNGKLQTTANTAITVTNSGGGNVACGCCYNNE